MVETAVAVSTVEKREEHFCHETHYLPVRRMLDEQMGLLSDGLLLPRANTQARSYVSAISKAKIYRCHIHAH